MAINMSASSEPSLFILQIFSTVPCRSLPFHSKCARFNPEVDCLFSHILQNRKHWEHSGYFQGGSAGVSALSGGRHWSAGAGGGRQTLKDRMSHLAVQLRNHNRYPGCSSLIPCSKNTSWFDKLKMFTSEFVLNHNNYEKPLIPFFVFHYVTSTCGITWWW